MTVCIEKKLTLSGEVKTFRCELVSLRDGVGVLRYVIDREYDVSGFKLSPGDMTLAVYWEDRPYTLYIWDRKLQHDKAYYFNIADSVTLQSDEFVWRDLSVDILIYPRGMIHILDEHELPPDLPEDLSNYIKRSKQHILSTYRTIIREADGLTAAG